MKALGWIQGNQNVEQPETSSSVPSDNLKQEEISSEQTIPKPINSKAGNRKKYQKTSNPNQNFEAFDYASAPTPTATITSNSKGPAVFTQTHVGNQRNKSNPRKTTSTFNPPNRQNKNNAQGNIWPKK